MLVESILILILWSLLFLLVPRLFLATYLPGFFLGLGLCQVQGLFEHAKGTTSHYGALYNFIFFNDGYHVEHHARPATHWSQLRLRAVGKGTASRWPALLRWIEFINLDGLERLALRSQLLQRLMISSHERAFRRLLSHPWNIHRVSIVGGGLFPRTALILQRLVPHAPLRIIDVSAENWERARRFLNRDVEFVHELYNPSGSPTQDLVVIPLAYIGERVKIYQDPPASIVLVHDWIWRRRGESVIISWLLLKRLNLIRR